MELGFSRNSNFIFPAGEITCSRCTHLSVDITPQGLQGIISDIFVKLMSDVTTSQLHHPLKVSDFYVMNRQMAKEV